jgi:hypothetical protein
LPLWYLQTLLIKTNVYLPVTINLSRLWLSCLGSLIYLFQKTFLLRGNQNPNIEEEEEEEEQTTQWPKENYII